MTHPLRRHVFAALTALALMAPSAGWAKDEKPFTMVVEFAIKDYAAWRPVFDGAEAQRVTAGVTNPRIYRGADKQEQVLVLFDVASRKQGMDWMRSPKLREDWRTGGVIGVPKHHFMR